LVESLVGPGPAGEFESFARMWQSEITKIVDRLFAGEQPSKLPLPTEPAQLYAVASALGRQVTREHLGATLTYAARLPREFEIMLVVDALRRDPSLSDDKAFAAWAQRNQDVMI
jgi:hypothetical protein